ncbi:MAG: trigger factor, partial [Bacteroidota bacterium]|nr:trigger factor [Bacteroidota bacterium]
VITFDLQEVFDQDAAAISHVTGLKKSEAAELNGNFEFAVEKINRTTAAEFNQDLFDKVFGKDAVTTEEEFNTKLRETLAENYQQEADKVLKNKIVEKLVNETNITLPEEFFKKWLAISNQGKLTPEQIEENFDRYKDELKWSMIRNKVVEENDVKVSNQEVVDATKAKMFAQFNMPEISEELSETMNGYIDNYLKQNNGRNYINEYEAILAEKVLDVLKDKVTVVEKSVTADEFRNLSF